ncbi:MAG: hypothetical protein QOI78_240, partial [Actinomycetota bacterium]|nr:hypothetical protein [Actinomycetota bacterium]
MASPDTEELATVPLPTPAPDTEKAPQQVPEDPAASAAETAPHQVTEAPASPSPDAPAVGDAAESEPGAAGADRRADAASADEDSSPETVEQAAAKPAKQGGRWWRGFTGSLAAGL